MKYAAVVLRNNQSPLSSVKYEGVADAFLAGGVFLEEIQLLPYDCPSLVSSQLSRLALDCDSLFVICDRVLLPSAREAVSVAADADFEDEYLLETEKCFYAVIPAGKRGEELVAQEIVPKIDARRNKRYSRVAIKTVGAPQDALINAMRAAERAGEGKLTLHAAESFGDGKIELIYDQDTPKMVADDAVRVLASALGDYVYAMEDTSIAERLVEACKLHRLKISTAESFTGGGVGGAIVAVPGASEVFYEGLNTYDNQSKQVRLGVKVSTLQAKGAVSDETAYEMAAGLIASGTCDLAIATTGIAGPKSDNTAKPVGLCYLAIGTKERVRVYRFHLSGDRENITKTAINLALFYAYREIK